MASTIRLHQINQSDLSGFLENSLATVLTTTGLNVGGAIIPTQSGTYNLGTTGQYFQNLYTNQISIPSGSGINFGNNLFTAYVSGGAAYLKLNNFTVTSSTQGVSIIGPQGPSGLQGIQGVTGATGISITGYTNVNNKLTFYFSNSSSGQSIQLPSGATGATGAYVTGFLNSGNFISPVFSNGTTGNSIFVPSGTQGPQGPVGNIYINFQQLTGFRSGDITPYVVIPNINPSVTQNPPINLVRGMSYGFGYSGLNTLITGGTGTNFFIDDNGITGYLQFTIFNNSAIQGRFLNGETNLSYSTVNSWVASNEVELNPIIANNLNSISFNVNFDSNDSYYYGFQRYALGNQSPIDDNVNQGEWGFYVLGSLNNNFFGPTGPSGQQGIPGIPGPQGSRGPAGINGQQGVGVTGVNSNGAAIQLLFSDGSTSQSIPLPSGGPTGAMGLQGLQGASGLQGPQGLQGPTGSQGFADTYFAEFFPNDMVISGFTGFYKQVSGASTWTQCIGTGRVLSLGDKIWFTTPSLVGKAYSPWQNIIFSDDNFNTARYFYASVVSFNNNNGELQCVANQNPSPAGLVGGSIQLFNYSLIDVNLGGLGSSGAVGPIGPQGPMGNTGHSIFINTGGNLSPSTTFNITPGSFDAWNLVLTGSNNTINIVSSSFTTGQTVVIKVRNTGSLMADVSQNPPPQNQLINWNIDNTSGIYFSYNIPAPAPDAGNSSIYTLLRWPDINNLPAIFCTYASNFPI